MKAQRVKSLDTDRYPAVRSLTVDGIDDRFSHQIGVGAFTRVYKATDEWGHALVVKVFTSGTPEAAWKNEAQQLRRFAGLRIVYLLRVFQHEDHTYLVSDDAGVSVSRCRFKEAETRQKAAVLVAKSILPALGRLHSAKHCHGDINPQNVLVKTQRDGTIDAACLVDFGLCRSQEKLSAGRVAMARWVPPPKYLRKAPMTVAALDIWHMAVLLLQIMTGERLDYSEEDILKNTIFEDAMALDLPLADAILPALSLEPTHRPDGLSLWRSIRSTLT